MNGIFAGLFVIAFLVLRQSAIAEDPATNLKKEVGAESFLSSEGKVVGVSIPGNHSGFEPPTELPTALTKFFQSDRPHPANAPLDVVLGSRTNFDSLIHMTDLKWVKYCGSSNKLDTERRRRTCELERFKSLTKTLKGTRELRAIALFDAVLPADGITTLMQLETIESVVLIRCETELANGAYKELPETHIKLGAACNQK